MANKEDIIATLRLINTPKIGAKSFFDLLGDAGSIRKALDNVLANPKLEPWTKERAEAEFDNAAKQGIKILLYSDEEYPQALKNSNVCPPLLYAKGKIDILNTNNCVAIVGSRSASINGRKIASQIAYHLAENGVCIISGMARGIDASAHKGAMYSQQQNGPTIAVLGTGVDVVYPLENQSVYDEIEQNGCIISEVPLGTKAVAANFPRRNRIVAAMANAIVVVEAGINSGSLITAKFGAEMHKMLFAVPGTPGESRTSGSNMLIKNGAILAETADDILPFLKGNKIISTEQKEILKQKVLVFENNDVNYSEQKKEPKGLVKFLTFDGTDIDELIRTTGKTPAEIAMEILELELEGVIERRAGNKIALINKS